jgi:hypothetical protein
LSSTAQSVDEYLLDNVELVEVGTTTTPLPDTPQLVEPFDVEGVTASAARFAWNRARHAEEYLLHIGTDPNFGGMVVDTVLADTVCSVRGLEAGTTYYVRLRARGSAGESENWATASFAPPVPKTMREAVPAVPAEYVLEQNFPNPFNPVTTIRYGVPFEGRVLVRLYDAVGREVAELVNDVLAAGYHAVQVDASDLPSGVYFYHLDAGVQKEVRRMVLIK